MPLKNPVLFIPGAILPHDYKDGGYFKNLDQLKPNGSYYVVPVKHWASISENSAIIEEFIKINFANQKFHIVAHSKGGVDTLSWFQSTNFRSQVLSFVSMASPFKGTKLANLLYYLSLVIPGAGSIRSTLYDLRTNQMSVFSTLDNPPNTAYISSISRKLNQISPLLMLAWIFLKISEGPNDGVVSLNSSQRGKQLKTFYCDHPALIGHFKTKKRMKYFENCLEVISLYQQEVEEC